MKSNVNQSILIAERKRIGLALREKREQLKLTSEDLAGKLNISRSTISKIENGKWNCGIDTITTLGAALNFKINI